MVDKINLFFKILAIFHKMYCGSEFICFKHYPKWAGILLLMKEGELVNLGEDTEDLFLYFWIVHEYFY